MNNLMNNFINDLRVGTTELSMRTHIGALPCRAVDKLANPQMVNRVETKYTQTNQKCQFNKSFAYCADCDKRNFFVRSIVWWCFEMNQLANRFAWKYYCVETPYWCKVAIRKYTRTLARTHLHIAATAPILECIQWHQFQFHSQTLNDRL